MEDLTEYFLQKQEGGEWAEIVKSYESASLIFAAAKREERGQRCRVISHAGAVLWQGKGAPISEDAHQGNG